MGADHSAIKNVIKLQLKMLRRNKVTYDDYDEIIIIKPDKHIGVIILNKSDYTTKVNSIEDDVSTFP